MEVGNSSFAETLPGEDTDFDFRLVEPTSMFGRVVNGESVPDLTADLRAEKVRQRFTAMDVQVVHDEVDCVSVGVLKG
jgi:hypothetical protein